MCAVPQPKDPQVEPSTRDEVESSAQVLSLVAWSTVCVVLAAKEPANGKEELRHLQLEVRGILCSLVI